MIGTICRIGFLNLKRDRVALLMTFILPIVFFSIFAMVFGGNGGEGTNRVPIAIADEDGSDASRRLIAALTANEGLAVTTVSDDEAKTPLDRTAALALVQKGKLPVALVVPKGFAETFGTSSGDSSGKARGGPGAPDDPSRIVLYADKSDPIAPQMVFGLLQEAAMTAAPDLLAKNGLATFERESGGFTPQQREFVDRWLPELRESATPKTPSGTPHEPGTPQAAGASSDADFDGTADSSDGGGFRGIVAVNVVDVLGEHKTGGLIAFYAAGTGVMFLLFSVSSAAGALLDDQESGALERILTSRIGMSRLLLAKWISIAVTGMIQVTVMFLWGSLVFGLDLAHHIPGFVVMTLFTGASAAGLGLVLATLARTRAQLSGLSTITVLVMSAIGGSMFPRFLMPPMMQKAGLLTFNAWALDGYQKVFWYDQPVASLWPQVAVLALLTLVFLATARFLARRWEAV